VLVASGALALAYAFPGYMNYDAAAQLAQARARVFDDWHPPVMAKYWHLIEHVWPGPLPLLLLQLALFLWGLYRLLAPRLGDRRAAVSASMILVFPPVLVVMAVVWKDAQMIAWLIAGLALSLDPRRWHKALGIALLCIAIALRYNASAALLPLTALIVVAPGMRALKAAALSLALFAAIVLAAAAVNSHFTTRHSHPWVHTNAIHDIAGTLCKAGPLSDDELRAELAGMKLHQPDHLQQWLCTDYSPRWWFSLLDDKVGVFEAKPDDAERAARRTAWSTVVRSHPRSFLVHRLTVFAAVLGLDGAVPDEPVCQTFGTPLQAERLGLAHDLSSIQTALGDVFNAFAKTPLFRPWLYALVALVLAGYAVKKREGLLLALVTSGLLYEAAYLIGAAGAPYRYSHYLIVCTCAGLALLQRYRPTSA